MITEVLGVDAACPPPTGGPAPCRAERRSVALTTAPRGLTSPLEAAFPMTKGNIIPCELVAS
jgi:hypothetical protein